MEESYTIMKDEQNDKNNDKNSEKKKYIVVYRNKTKRNLIDYKKGNNCFKIEYIEINDDKYKIENDNIIKEELNNFQKIEMDEKDKMFMNISDFLKSHEDLNVDETIIFNQEVTFKIENTTPYHIIMKDNELYMIDKKSRKINFVDYKSKTINSKFIYNCDNLIDSLESLGFTSYYVKLPKQKNNKSNEESETSSENVDVSLSNPFSIFDNEEIKYIFNENERPILTEDNFKNIFRDKLNSLKDLSTNAKYYYGKYNKCRFSIINNYANAQINLYRFQYSKISKILYLYGPKRSSKTTLLLYMINHYRIFKTKTLYFNHNYLENKDFLESKKRIYHELLYFCKDIEEMKKFEEKKIFSKIENSDIIMKIIYVILSNLFEIIGEEKEYRRIVIIDNIKEMNENNTLYLNNIIK